MLYTVQCSIIRGTTHFLCSYCTDDSSHFTQFLGFHKHWLATVEPVYIQHASLSNSSEFLQHWTSFNGGGGGEENIVQWGKCLCNMELYCTILISMYVPHRHRYRLGAIMWPRPLLFDLFQLLHLGHHISTHYLNTVQIFHCGTILSHTAQFFHKSELVMTHSVIQISLEQWRQAGRNAAIAYTIPFPRI